MRAGAKLLIPILLLLVAMLTACGSKPESGGNAEESADNASTAGAGNEAAGTFTYQSETGPVEVPANPKRIVALTNALNALSIGGNVVGIDEWTSMNPLFKERFPGIPVVSEENLEGIIEQKPDLIIAGTETKNLDKLKQIAPTVAYTWGKLDYLAQQVEIGKLLNKEEETKAWVADYTKRAEDLGRRIKEKIGQDATVSVFETDSKEFYVFGNNWARGTEILYQAMGLNMPEKVKQDALGPGYYTLSQETLADYAGDYLVISKSAGGDNSFMQSETWKNIPAVKNGHVIELETESATYSDPISLDYLMKIFEEGFLGKE